MEIIAQIDVSLMILSQRVTSYHDLCPLLSLLLLCAGIFTCTGSELMNPSKARAYIIHDIR